MSSRLAALRLCQFELELALPEHLTQAVQKFYAPAFLEQASSPRARLSFDGLHFYVEGEVGVEFGREEQPALLRLESGLLQLLQRWGQEQTLLHAAGVLYEGQLLLFLGDSDAGKSTLCLEALREAACYLSDDLLSLTAQECFGFARSLRFNRVSLGLDTRPDYLSEMDCETYRVFNRDGEFAVPFFPGAYRALPSLGCKDYPTTVVRLLRGPNKLSRITHLEALSSLHSAALSSAQPYCGQLRLERAFELSWQEPSGAFQLLKQAWEG